MGCAGSAGALVVVVSTDWEEVAGGRLRLCEGRVGGHGHNGAVAGRARRRGRRELRHVEGGVENSKWALRTHQSAVRGCHSPELSIINPLR